MADPNDHRQKFDRFAQDRYLQQLLKTDADEIIPSLFLDLMDRVNAIQGEAGLILAEAERAKLEQTPPRGSLVEINAIHVLERAVDATNILKALMEYYEITHGEDNASHD